LELAAYRLWAAVTATAEAGGGFESLTIIIIVIAPHLLSLFVMLSFYNTSRSGLERASFTIAFVA